MKKKLKIKIKFKKKTFEGDGVRPKPPLPERLSGIRRLWIKTWGGGHLKKIYFQTHIVDRRLNWPRGRFSEK